MTKPLLSPPLQILLRSIFLAVSVVPLKGQQFHNYWIGGETAGILNWERKDWTTNDNWVDDSQDEGDNFIAHVDGGAKYSLVVFGDDVDAYGIEFDAVPIEPVTEYSGFSSLAVTSDLEGIFSDINYGFLNVGMGGIINNTDHFFKIHVLGSDENERSRLINSGSLIGPFEIHVGEQSQYVDYIDAPLFDQYGFARGLQASVDGGTFILRGGVADSQFTILDGGIVSLTENTASDSIFTVNNSLLAISADLLNSDVVSNNGSIFFGPDGSANNLSTIEINGGTLDISRAETNNLRITSLSGGANVFLGGKNLIVDQGGETVMSGILRDGYLPFPGFANPANSELGGLTKLGAGRLELTGANIYTGNTYINGGTLATNNIQALGIFNGNQYSNGVQLNSGAALELISNLTVQKFEWANGTIRLNPANSQLTVNDWFRFSGSPDSKFQIAGNLGLGNYTLVNFGNTNYTDPAVFSAEFGSGNPNVNLEYEFQLNQNSLVIDIIGATATGPWLQNSEPINIPAFADFTIDGARSDLVAPRTVYTGTDTESNVINSLKLINKGSLEIRNNLQVTSGKIESIDGYAIRGGSLSAGVGNNFQFDVTNSSNDSAVDLRVLSVILGDHSLIKSGAGTLILNADNAYTRNTVVEEGTLGIYGDQSASTGTVIVDSHGILEGSDNAVGGDVTFNDMGVFSPGDSNTAGVFTIAGSLNLANFSRMWFNLATFGSPGDIGNDLIAVGEDLNLNGSLNILGNRLLDEGAYRLINYGGSLTDNGLVISNIPAGMEGDYIISTAVDGQVNLIVTGPDNIVQYWDGSAGPANDGVVQGGNGLWTNFNPFFTDPTALVNAAWQNGTAIFAGAGGTVTVDDEIHVQGIQFDANGYTLSSGTDPDTGLVLDTVDGSRTAMIVSPDILTTINAPIRGEAGLDKLGSGRLILGNVGNSYTGGTRLSAGALQISDDRVLGASTSELEIGHRGILELASNVEVARALRLDGGSSFDYSQVDTMGNDAVLSGMITDHSSAPGGLAKVGTGTLTLTHLANSFSLGATVEEGTLVQGEVGAFTSGAAYSAYGEGVLDLGGHDLEVSYLEGDGTVDIGGNAYLEIATPDSLRFERESLNTQFDGNIVGGGSIEKSGKGDLILTGASSYSGDTFLNEGRIGTDNLSALGTSTVFLSQLDKNAILNPVSSLNAEELWWYQGGAVEVVLGPTLLTVTTDITRQADATGLYLLNHDGVNPLEQSYVVTTFGGETNFTADALAAEFSHDIQNVEFEYGFEVTDSEIIFEFTGATAWGPILQNSAPVFTPTFADFIVRGPVRTGDYDESNIIKSLTFDPGSSLRVYNNLEVSSGEFTVNSGRAEINGGSLKVPGSFHKRGGGLLDIGSRVTVAGTSTIHAGALAVNGVFKTPLMIVSNGATLMGAGVVDGSVLNSGIVAPGNSIGTLTITQDYTQTSSGRYAYEVASPDRHDLLVVGRTARLDGTLELIPVSGYRPTYGDSYPVIVADKIRGRFASIEVPSPEINRGRFFALDQLTERSSDAGVGMLVLAPASYTLVADGRNQLELATALDEWIGIEDGSDISRVTLALDLLPEEVYPYAFDQILPHPQSVALSLASDIGQRQNRELQGMLDSRRLGRRALRQARSEGTIIAGVVDVPSAKSGKAPTAPALSPAPEYQWNAWAQGGGSLSGDALQSDVDADFDSWGVLTGIDRAFSDELALGLLLGYTQAEAELGGGSDVEFDSITAGLYATWDRGGFYANGALAGGPTDADVTRRIRIPGLSERTARSTADGHSVLALLSGGYDFRAGNWTHGPTSALSWSRTELDFNEQGADALDLDINGEGESLQSRLGYRVAYNARVSDRLTLIPQLSATWEHEYMDPSSVDARLNGGDGPRFRYQGDASDSDRLLLGVGLGAQIGDRVYTHIGYQARMGDDTIHTATVGVNVSF